MYRLFIGLVIFSFLFVQNSILLAANAHEVASSQTGSSLDSSDQLMGRIESKAAPKAHGKKSGSGHRGHRRVRRVYVVRRYVKPGETSASNKLHSSFSSSNGPELNSSPTSSTPDTLASKDPTECAHKKLLGAVLGADGKCSSACELCKQEGCHFDKGICTDCPKCEDHKKQDLARKRSSDIPTVVQYIEVPEGTQVPSKNFSEIASTNGGDYQVIPVDAGGVPGNAGKPAYEYGKQQSVPASVLGAGAPRKPGRLADEVESGPVAGIPVAGSTMGNSGPGRHGVTGPYGTSDGTSRTGEGYLPPAGGPGATGSGTGIQPAAPIVTPPGSQAETQTPAAPVVMTGGVPMPADGGTSTPPLLGPIPAPGGSAAPMSPMAPIPANGSNKLGGGGFGFPTGLATTIGGLAIAGGLVTALVLASTLHSGGGHNSYGFFPYLPSYPNQISAPTIASNTIYVPSSTGSSASSSSGSGSGSGFGGSGGSCGSGNGSGSGSGSGSGCHNGSGGSGSGSGSACQNGGGSASGGSGSGSGSGCNSGGNGNGGYGNGGYGNGGNCGNGNGGYGNGGYGNGGNCGNGNGGYGNGGYGNGGYGNGGNCDNGNGGYGNGGNCDNGNGGYGNGGYGNGGYGNGGYGNGSYGNGGYGNGGYVSGGGRYPNLPATATSCVDINVVNLGGCNSITSMGCSPDPYAFGDCLPGGGIPGGVFPGGDCPPPVDGGIIQPNDPYNYGGAPNCIPGGNDPYNYGGAPGPGPDYSSTSYNSNYSAGDPYSYSGY